MAQYKADFLNAFIAEHGVDSVVELGCGDGNQLSLAEYPRYLGLDVSHTAVETCRRLFTGDANKSFEWYDSQHPAETAAFPGADLALSLDVIFHLVEDAVFERYMVDLFNAARRWVIVYAADIADVDGAAHVRHRRFTDWTEVHATEWRLVDKVPNPLVGHLDTVSQFFVFARLTTSPDVH